MKSAKKIVEDFYKSDALIDPQVMDTYLHPEIILDWNSSKGFLQLTKSEILAMTTEMSKAYVRSKARISHILHDDSNIAVRYSHYIKTIENPREEMLLAHFMVIWELKEGKLFRGFQMSQLS